MIWLIRLGTTLSPSARQATVSQTLFSRKRQDPKSREIDSRFLEVWVNLFKAPLRKIVGSEEKYFQCWR